MTLGEIRASGRVTRARYTQRGWCALEWWPNTGVSATNKSKCKMPRIAEAS